jgi:hypothetical protein
VMGQLDFQARKDPVSREAQHAICRRLQHLDQARGKLPPDPSPPLPARRAQMRSPREKSSRVPSSPSAWPWQRRSSAVRMLSAEQPLWKATDQAVCTGKELEDQTIALACPAPVVSIISGPTRCPARSIQGPRAALAPGLIL